jgi:hypothetical protein
MTTIGDVLAPDLAAIEQQARSALAGTKAIVDLPPLTRQAVFGQVAAPVKQLGRTTIGEAMKFGWTTGRALRAAAQESLRTGEPVDVLLNGLNIPVEYRPELHVIVAGKKIASVPFGLTVEMELLKFAGQVTKGRLVRMHAEVFQVGVSVSVATKAVAGRKVPLQLQVELPMPTDGIPLVSGA